MRRIRATATVAMLVCVLAVFSRQATALESFGITPDKKLAKALNDLADTCYECGEKAREKGLFTSARSYFNHALEYDVDHKQTRKVMGFKKKAGAWVLDENLVPLSDKVPAAKLAEVEGKLFNETRPIRAKAAENLFKFVADKGLPAEQRLLALYHVLQIAPENAQGLAAARAGVEKFWFKHYIDEPHQLKIEERLKAAPEPELVKEPTPYETATGYTMVKRKTPWFITHFDLGMMGESWGPGLTRMCEASRTHVLELMGTPSPAAPKEDAHRLHFTVFGARDRFGVFVEKCSGIPDAAQRAEVARASGGTPVYRPYGSVWLCEGHDNDVVIRDAMAHDTAYKEVNRCTGDGGYWLAQGMGYLNSAHMVGSTAARFFGVKSSAVIESAGKEVMPGLGDNAAGWRLHVALAVAGGKAMTPSQVAGLRLNDYTNHHMAFAMSWADYLTSQCAEQMKTFFESAWAEGRKRFTEKQPPETAAECLKRLYEALETDEAEFTKAFGTWVLANYVRLPA